MMNSIEMLQKQRGVALVTVLLFLVVVSVISLTAAQNSALGLKMSGGMQDSYRSFEAAEAGIYAAFRLAGGAQDPFTPRGDVEEPFADLDLHPLRNQAADPSDIPVDVDVHLISMQQPLGLPSLSSQIGARCAGAGTNACRTRRGKDSDRKYLISTPSD
jgi:hypothetical protein